MQGRRERSGWTARARPRTKQRAACYAGRGAGECRWEATSISPSGPFPCWAACLSEELLEDLQRRRSGRVTAVAAVPRLGRLTTSLPASCPTVRNRSTRLVEVARVAVAGCRSSSRPCRSSRDRDGKPPRSRTRVPKEEWVASYRPWRTTASAWASTFVGSGATGAGGAHTSAAAHWTTGCSTSRRRCGVARRPPFAIRSIEAGLLHRRDEQVLLADGELDRVARASRGCRSASDRGRLLRIGALPPVRRRQQPELRAEVDSGRSAKAEAARPALEAGAALARHPVERIPDIGRSRCRTTDCAAPSAASSPRSRTVTSS